MSEFKSNQTINNYKIINEFKKKKIKAEKAWKHEKMKITMKKGRLSKTKKACKHITKKKTYKINEKQKNEENRTDRKSLKIHKWIFSKMSMSTFCSARRETWLHLVFMCSRTPIAVKLVPETVGRLFRKRRLTRSIFHSSYFCRSFNKYQHLT